MNNGIAMAIAAVTTMGYLSLAKPQTILPDIDFRMNLKEGIDQ